MFYHRINILKECVSQIGKNQIFKVNEASISLQLTFMRLVKPPKSGLQRCLRSEPPLDLVVYLEGCSRLTLDYLLGSYMAVL